MAIYIQKLGYEEHFLLNFACLKCHCEWYADDKDVKHIIDCRNDEYYSMQCPCCGATANSCAKIPRNVVLSPRPNILGDIHALNDAIVL